MYDMKRAASLTELNERSIRRYIKRFKIKLKRGAYNSYQFSDIDIRKLVVIRTMLKENHEDKDIMTEIARVDNGNKGEHDIKSELLSHKDMVNNKSELVAMEQLVDHLKTTVGQGMNSLSDSIDDIERNLSDRLEKGNNKLESISDILDDQKSQISSQKEEVLKQSKLIGQQKELILEQEKFLKMQIHQNMMLMKKMESIETRIDQGNLFSRMWQKIHCFFAGEKKKYQLKI